MKDYPLSVDCDSCSNSYFQDSTKCLLPELTGFLTVLKTEFTDPEESVIAGSVGKWTVVRRKTKSQKKPTTNWNDKGVCCQERPTQSSTSPVELTTSRGRDEMDNKATSRYVNAGAER